MLVKFHLTKEVEVRCKLKMAKTKAEAAEREGKVAETSVHLLIEQANLKNEEPKLGQSKCA